MWLVAAQAERMSRDERLVLLVAILASFVSFLDATGTTFAKVNTAYNITASNHSQVTFGCDLDQFGANNAASMGASIPDVRLLDGLQIEVSADAIDSADTITAVRLFVCQYDVRPDYSTANP